MAEKITLKHNGCGDTRNAPKDTTFEQFHEANISHILDVRAVMLYLARQLAQQGASHDWTKLKYEEEFWKNFQDSLLNGADFVNAEWYQRHIHTEKHHPTSYCHEDINLLDIIEMVVDCVCAGKARSGKVRPMEINDEILKKAFENTVKLIDDITEVKE
jgi:hypothetical protein